LSANDGSASTRLIVARNLSARTRFSPEAFSTGTKAPGPRAAIRRALLSRSE
jgi:hypothetical protein